MTFDQSLARARRSLGLGSPTTLAQVGGLGFGEILLILLALVFFFGAKRIPEIARGLGGGIRSFKQELKGSAPDAGAQQQMQPGAPQDAAPHAQTHAPPHAPPPQPPPPPQDPNAAR